MGLQVSDAAIKKIKDLVKKNQFTFLKFGVRGGGCSGFSYIFDFLSQDNAEELSNLTDEEIKVEWKVFKFDSFTILVDKKSYFFINETEIDWIEEVMGQRFVFNNPNVDSSCGCGESISFKI